MQLAKTSQIAMPLMLDSEVSVLQGFESVMMPLFSNIKSNTKQTQTLTELQDTLLPKLMSGEVRVR